MMSFQKSIRLFVLTAGIVSAQEAVDLDAVESSPPPSRRAGDGIHMGDLKFNIHFDGGLLWSKEANSGSKDDLRFMQEHTNLMARASTSEGIEVNADIVNPGQVFEATIPLKFFSSSLEGIPVLGEAAIKGGRMIVPFGDFDEHPIYGGSVSNSMLLRNVIWSDYGMGLMFPIGFSKTELYVVNGILAYDSVVEFTSGDERNELKGFGCRVRLDPVPWFFATGSLYEDYIVMGPDYLYPTDTLGYAPDGTPIFDTIKVRHDTPQDRVTFAGIDIGLRTGAFSWRAGGANAWITARYAPDGTEFSDYTKWGWYAESKWRINDLWALRLRGGQVDPDSRSADDMDQTNVNLAVIWSKGPVDARLTYFRNLETHWINDAARPMNKHRVLLETFISI